MFPRQGLQAPGTGKFCFEHKTESACNTSFLASCGFSESRVRLLSGIFLPGCERCRRCRLAQFMPLWRCLRPKMSQKAHGNGWQHAPDLYLNHSRCGRLRPVAWERAAVIDTPYTLPYSRSLIGRWCRFVLVSPWAEWRTNLETIYYSARVNGRDVCGVPVDCDG